MCSAIIRSVTIALVAVLALGWNVSARAGEDLAAWDGIKEATFGNFKH